MYTLSLFALAVSTMLYTTALASAPFFVSENSQPLRLCSKGHNRKNWLFANTPRGARASAIIYSIVETAKENGLNPFHYLSYLFEKLPNLNIKDEASLDKLLPWSDSLPSYCRVNK